ncbi:type I-MYXAN CRISPR-associated protein Cas6/Cmx6 [Leptolyngbya sp. FACHB-671]|nr:type I-MYXAN CRISPR-associated protein Cas6/Cmx6 [Leptolyngbya sp. FACHB-671]
MPTTTSTELPLLVELSFDVVGHAIPVDHAYELFSAIAHLQAQLHDLKFLSIQTITNTAFENNKLLLSKYSKLRIRLLVEQVRLVYSLANKSLMLGKDKIRLGIPKIDLLQPAGSLYSRMVVIKGHQEPELFLEAAQSQLKRLGIEGEACISVGSHGSLNRKTVKVRGYTVVGFGLEVAELSDQDSLKLQTYGIGGKRKMGCGIFVPK